MLRIWTALVPGVFAFLFTSAALGAPAEPPHGVWVGQDGHDYCQTSSALGPDDIQDLHVRFEGLPAGEEIESGMIRRQGGGEWAINGKGRSWHAHVIRDAGSTTADVFMEPSHDEESCQLAVELHYRSGQSVTFPINGGRSNPNLFMPTAVLQARWVGQDHLDWTGPGPAVGPDGFVDAQIAVSGISRRLEIQALTIEDPQGGKWEYGVNPHRLNNAELLRDAKDPTRGTLFFSPDRNLEEHKLTLRISYTIDRHNSATLAAGATDPKRPMPKPAMFPLSENHFTVRWLGQDGTELAGRGDVHVSLENLPAGASIGAAALSDPAGGYWIYPSPRPGDPPSMPLAIRRKDRASSADLFFQPYRDESDTPMVLRLLLSDGTTTIRPFTGGKCDPYIRGPQPLSTSIEAKPGDDLHALAEKIGEIRLAPGRYVLDRPLKLPHPITITGPRDSIIEFTQKADDKPWTGAILVGGSNTTLRGFSIRVADNFRWQINGPGGAAIIRSLYQPKDPRANIVLEKLDIQGSSVPLPADPKKTPEAAYLVRFEGATSGKIIGNRLRGGTVDIYNGPWLIADNQYVGAMPGTFVYDAFGAHWVHDLTLERNRISRIEPAGKTWRFISMNQRGQSITIRDNDVSGVGMRDDDTIPNQNTPEILLTETYRLYFEGYPSGISNNGQVLQVPMVMYGTILPGSMVSILDGEHAGEYFPIAQPITPTTLLMASPLPPGHYAISIAHGYVDTSIERNCIDVRGGPSAIVVLAGNHWNLRLANNHLLGGGETMRIQSTPTENPFIWGWSHTPFLDLLCEGNVCEDSRRGIAIDVYSDRHNKTSAGRTYMTGTIRNNTLGGTKDAQFRIGRDTADPNTEMKLVIDGQPPFRPTP